METERNKLVFQSRSFAFLSEMIHTLLKSAVWHGLVKNGRIGFEKYRRVLSYGFVALKFALELMGRQSGLVQTGQKGILAIRRIRRKIALYLDVSPGILSLIHFLFVAQLVVLPLTSVLSLSMTNAIWGGISFTLFLLLLFQKNVCSPEKNDGIILFGVTVTVSAFWATFKIRNDYYLLMVLYLVLAWLAGRVLTKDHVRAIMKYSVFSSVLWIMLGIVQKISGAATPPGWISPEQAGFITVRIYSIFKNPNVFALYLVVMLIWAYYLRRDVLDRRRAKEFSVSRIPHPWSSPLLMGFMVLDGLALYLTYSRIVWLIAGLLILAWNRNHIRPKNCFWIGGILTAAFFLLPDFQSRLASGLTLSDSSFWNRIGIWRGVIKTIGDCGWWGAGPGSFSAAYSWFGAAAPWAQHAHNQYLHIWLENGFVSLIVFIAIIIKGVRRFFGEDLIVRAMGLSLAAFLVYGVTDTWTASPFLGGLFWLMMGFGNAARLDVIHGDAPVQT